MANPLPLTSHLSGGLFLRVEAAIALQETNARKGMDE